MKTLRIFVFALTVIVGCGLTACQRSENVEAAREADAAAADRTTTLTTDEKEFTDYAAEMHAGEIKLAQLAKQKSSNEAVMDYADAVISTHTDALKELSDRTSQDRSLQDTNASTDTQRHAEYLSPLSGAKFDQEFIALMIADHKDAANTFNMELSSTRNKELTSYVKEVMPSLENDLSEGQKVQKALTSIKTR